MSGKILMKRRVSFVLILTVQSRSSGCCSFFSTTTACFVRSQPDTMGEERGALVLGQGCSDLDVVSSYDIGMTRCKHLANLWWWRQPRVGWQRRRSLDEALRRWAAPLASFRPRRGSGQHQRSPTMLLDQAVELGAAWRWQWLVGKTCGNGARCCRLIRTGRAPIYRENPSTHNGCRDELDSISNLNQTRWILTELTSG
jgi:hypothetical protein